MNFNDLIARADEATIQSLLGAPTLKLVGALDSALLLPSKLKHLLLGLYGREGLLDNSRTRQILIDLLRPTEARQLAQVLGVSGGNDVYESLRKLSVASGSSREKLLYAYFGLEVPKREIAEETPAYLSITSTYGLFPHQRRAAREVATLLETGLRRVLLHMPTGAGKTRTAMNIVADHLRHYEPGLVIWLAYSEELCEQAASEFERAWQTLGNRSLAVHRFWGSRTLDLAEVSDGILVAGLGKMYGLAQSSIYKLGQLGSRCTLVLMDEAHQAIAPTYQLVMEALLVHKPKTGLLGLTATPGRSWADIDEDEKLADFFARQKVTLAVEGYESPVDYLVEEQYLARVRSVPLFVDTGISLSQGDLDKLATGLDIPENVLQKLADDEQRNLAIIYKVEELVRSHKRSLVFAATVKHSDLLATILQARGHRAHSITGGTPSGDRAKLIDAFRSDDEEPYVLCNYGVLTTGFDAPKTSAVVIARPTKSLVLYSQMVGRAIRGPRAGGNEEAEVVSVVDQNLPGFGSVTEAFTNWEDVWR